MMIRFGNRVEPMTDDYLLEELCGVRFIGEKPQEIGRVLDFDEPWEAEGSLGLTIFEDDESIKMYYRGYPAVTTEGDYDKNQTACIAESHDGICFTKTPVNTIPYDGITKNNIVNIGSVCHNFSGFIDRNPACRPEEKYKAVCGHAHFGGLFAYGSPDGLHWHPLCDSPVITKGAFDSMNLAFYDTVAGCYWCYSRYWDEENGVRCIQNCSSEDFIHWTDPQPNLYPDVTVNKEHFYTNAATPIPGAEHVLLSIPMRFAEFRNSTVECDPALYRVDGDGEIGISDCILMTSRDGVHWDRKLKDAWLAGSLYPHEWTQRCFIFLGGIIVRGNDFYLYTEKNYMWNDDGIYAYRIPKFRFMSLYADRDGGTVLTKPLQFDSDTFYLNYATSAYGGIAVRILNEDGSVFAELPELYGNELSHPVRIEGLAGKVGRISLTLREAHLYAMGSQM